MFYFLSKVLWFLLHPLSLAFFSGLLGLVAGGLLHWRKVATALFVFSSVVLGLGAFTTVGQLLMAPLEQRFERPSPRPAEISGIIVLGGAFDALVSAGRGNAELTSAGDRYMEALALAGEYPEARIVIAGGVGALNGLGEGDTSVAARLFKRFFIDPERMVFESNSRNTHENAVFTQKLLQPKSGEVWLLVTSASHMPRSMGVFRAVEFDVVPWPTDYETDGSVSFEITLGDPNKNMAVLSKAMKEWIGLLAYRLTNKTEQLFPNANL